MRADRSVGTQRREGASYEASRTRDSVPTAENGVSENGGQAGRDSDSFVSFGPVQRASLPEEGHGDRTEAAEGGSEGRQVGQSSGQTQGLASMKKPQ